jgi:hypothetical protein
MVHRQLRMSPPSYLIQFKGEIPDDVMGTSDYD